MTSNPFDVFDDEPDSPNDTAQSDNPFAPAVNPFHVDSPEDAMIKHYAGMFDTAGRLDKLRAVGQSIGDELLANPPMAFQPDDPTTVTEAEAVMKATRARTPHFTELFHPQFAAGVGTGLTMFGEGLTQHSNTGLLPDVAGTVGSALATRGRELTDNAPALKVPTYTAPIDEFRKGNVGTALGQAGTFIYEQIGRGAGTAAPMFVAGAIAGTPGVVLAGWNMGIGQMRSALSEEMDDYLAKAQNAEKQGNPAASAAYRMMASQLDPEKQTTVIYLAGSAIGLLDAIMPAQVLSGSPHISTVKELTARYMISAIARGVAKGAGKEGVTEALQAATEVLGIARAKGADHAGAYLRALSENSDRILEEGVAGAAAGMGFGVVDSAGRIRQQQDFNEANAPLMEAAKAAEAAPNPFEQFDEQAATESHPEPAAEAEAAPAEQAPQAAPARIVPDLAPETRTELLEVAEAAGIARETPDETLADMVDLRRDGASFSPIYDRALDEAIADAVPAEPVVPSQLETLQTEATEAQATIASLKEQVAAAEGETATDLQRQLEETQDRLTNAETEIKRITDENASYEKLKSYVEAGGGVSQGATRRAAKAAGVRESALTPLLDRAVGEGLLRKDKRGKYRRTAQAAGAQFKINPNDPNPVPAAVQTAIRAMLPRLPKGTKVKTFSKPQDLPQRLGEAVENAPGQVDALFDDQTGDIYLSTAALDPKGRIGHEGIHALKNLGLFTAQEWSVLAERANKIKDLFDRKAYETLFRQRGYTGQRLKEAMDEEAVAHLYEARVNGQTFGKRIDGLIERIREFLERVGNVLKGQGFQSANDVMAAIDAGAVASRDGQAPSSDGPMFAMRREPSFTPKFRQSRAEIEQRLVGEIQRMLPPDVSIRIVPHLINGAAGRYLFRQKIIEIAVLDVSPGDRSNGTTFVQALETGRHEVIHALRMLDLAEGSTGTVFLNREWQLLVEHARNTLVGKDIRITEFETGDKVWGLPDYRELYTEQVRNAGVTGPDADAIVNEFIDQELVANMFQSWVSGKSFTAPIDKLLFRIRQILQALKNTLNGYGFRTVDDIFADIESGEIASRNARPSVSPEDISAMLGGPMFAMRENGPPGNFRQAGGFAELMQDAETGRSMRRDLDALGYYSQALEAAKALKQSKGTPQQMRAQLKAAGVKDAEIEATGLDAFLEGKKTVSRDEIVGHLEENRVSLREVRGGAYQKLPEVPAEVRADLRELDNLGFETTREAWQAIRSEPNWAENWDVDPSRGGADERLYRFMQENPGYAADVSRAAKWSGYSLDPSNPTYRETVLHLPETPIAARFNPVGHPERPGDWALVDAQGNYRMTERGDDIAWYRSEEFARNGARTIAEFEDWNGTTGMGRASFQSGHFSEPNIIGHMMTSMTRTKDGRNVYTVDQIQSDWGQKLRDGGVRDEVKIAKLQKAFDDANAAWEAFPKDRAEKAEGTYDPLEQVPFGWNRPLTDEANALLSARQLSRAELETAIAATPGNPLVNTTDQWVNTTLRRAIRQAAEADADAIAIPSGKTVLSYNPGDEHGMEGFYDKIVPKNLRNLLSKIDKASPAPERIATLNSPSGKSDLGKGFTLFPLTDAVKQSVINEGQPMFAMRADAKAELPPLGKIDLGFGAAPVGAKGELDAAVQRRRDLIASLPREVSDYAHSHFFNSSAMLQMSSGDFATSKEQDLLPLVEQHKDTIDAIRAAQLEINQKARELDGFAMADQLAKAAQEPRPADAPMMVYHGTDQAFDTYSGEVARSLSAAAQDVGIDTVFVTPSKEFAERYGTPMPLELKSGFYFDLENMSDVARIAPFINARPDAKKFWDRIESGGQTWGLLEGREIVTELQRLGYDGVKMTEDYYNAQDRRRLAGTLAVFTRGKVVHRGTDQPMFAMRPDDPVRGMASIIRDLVTDLGLTVRQGKGYGRFLGYNPYTGVSRQSSYYDIQALSQNAGRTLEQRFGAPFAKVLAQHADDLTLPPAPSTPAPRLRQRGFSGLELDANLQKLLVQATVKGHEHQKLAVEVGSIKGASRMMPGRATVNPGLQTRYDEANRAAGEARRQLIRRLGENVVRAIEADVATQVPDAIDPVAPQIDPAAIEAYIAQRFSATGVPQAPAPTQAPSKDELSDAFAEWMQLYITNPSLAERQAPGLYDAFEDTVDDADPILLAKLQDTQEAIQQLSKAAPTDLMQSMVAPVEKLSAFGQLLRDASRDGYVPTLGHRLSRIYTNLWDKTHPFYLSVQRLLEIHEANTGNRLDLPAIENSYKILRLAASSHAWAGRDLMDGIKPRGSVTGQGASLTQALRTALGDDRAEALDMSPGSKYRQFGAYLVARRAVQLWEDYRLGQIPNPPTMQSREAAEAAIKKFEADNPTFKDGAAQIYEFQRNLLALQRDAGLISEQQYDSLVADEDYVPFLRSFEEVGEQAGSGRAVKGKTSIIKRLRGSNRDIIDPIASIAQKVYDTRQRIAVNDSLQALIKLAETAGPGAGAIAERLDANRAKGVTVDVTTVLKNAAREAGVDANDAQSLAELAQDLIGAEATATIFTQQQISEGKEPIVWMLENGKPVPIRLADGWLGSQMLDLLSTFGNEHSNWMIEAMAVPTQFVRGTITSNPSFIIRNMFVDGLLANMYERGAWPWLTQVRGFVEAVAGSESVRQYAANAGLMGGAATSGLDQLRFDRAVRQLVEKGYAPKIWSSPKEWLSAMTDAVGADTVLGKVRLGTGIAAGAVLGGPYGALAGAGVATLLSRRGRQTLTTLSEASETGTRAQLYGIAFDRAKANGLNDAAAATEAAFFAHDYMDYSRRGSKTEPVAKIVAFFNAAMQGMDRYYRLLAAKGDYGSAWGPYFKYRMGGGQLTAREKAELSQSAYAWFVSIGVFGTMSAVVAAIWGDDERSREIPEEIRATHWVIPLDGAHHLIPKEIPGFKEWAAANLKDQALRLPKPFETAWFANLLERTVMQMAQDDPRWFEGYVNDLWETMLPPMMPQGLQLPVELYAGKSLFTGRDIVPKWKQDRLIERQFDEYTSEFSKWMGPKVGVSPFYVDHSLKGLGTSWARDFLSLNVPGTPWYDPNKPDKSVDDYFIARRFLWKVGKGSESGQAVREIMGAEDPIRVIWGRIAQPYSKLGASGQTYRDYMTADDPASAVELLGRLTPPERGYAIMAGHFTERNAKYRNLHPMNRAEKVMREIIGIQKEILSDRVLSDKKTKTQKPIPLNPSEKAAARDILVQMQMMEGHNALVVTGEIGWAQRELFQTRAVLEELRAAVPSVAKEYERRLEKAGVLPFDGVRRVWPDVKRKLEDPSLVDKIRAGQTAGLTSMLAIEYARARVGGAGALRAPQPATAN